LSTVVKRSPISVTAEHLSHFRKGFGLVTNRCAGDQTTTVRFCESDAIKPASVTKYLKSVNSKTIDSSFFQKPTNHKHPIDFTLRIATVAGTVAETVATRVLTS